LINSTGTKGKSTMKAKQKNLRIFEINIANDDEFFAYMNKNLILLKDFFLLIDGHISEKIKEYLDEQNLCYKFAKDCTIKMPSKHNTNESRAIMEETETPKAAVSKEPSIRIISEKIKTLLIEQPIRSGREIVHEGDVTIFGRVNSASKVIAEGNVEVYGVIDGLVQCDGDYMIVKELGKGHIIFNGDILDRDAFDGKLKKVTYGKEGAIIKDLFETANY
jgi:septum site-determining protein MinC